MLTPGPVEIVVAVLLSLRRFGLGKTLLGAIVVGVGIQPLLPPVSCSCIGPLFRRCDNSIRYKSILKSDLKNLASQQEIYFSDAMRYGEDFRAMAYTPSDGVTVEVKAGAQGWTAWATHAALGREEGCAIYFGMTPPTPNMTPPTPNEGAPSWTKDMFESQPGEVACT